MKTLVTLPTYNESENIVSLIQELLALPCHPDVLVVDDNSPDGTWKIVQKLANDDSRIRLIHRINERGRGTAGIAAFIYARDHGYDSVVEMDADFSHTPKTIPSLLEPIKNNSADIVIGSRLVEGGGESGRNFSRKLITLAANLYIRVLLRLPVKDCTTGFRVYNRKSLVAIPWEKLTATGPEIVQDVLIAGRNAKLKMVEKPILFEERRAGESTFNFRIMRKSLLYVLKRAVFG